MELKNKRFAFYAWGVVLYNLVVIAWGAYVRASGSGAGCGSHWPLCNGEVIPTAPQIKTIVEFTHRLSSGLALLSVVGLLIWSLFKFERRHIVRRGAALSLFFMLTEALVGAGLVLFELVADNKSIARAMFMSVHLANTFTLLAMLTLTAWWATSGLSIRLRNQSKYIPLLTISILVTIVLGISGAVAALGDTLFPSGSLQQALSNDFSPTAHLLVRLRLLHPIIAILSVALSLITALYIISSRPTVWTRRFAYLLAGLAITQLGVGVINVYLLAPAWLQLVHLILADLVWISLVLLMGATLATEAKVSLPQMVFEQGLPVTNHNPEVGA